MRCLWLVFSALLITACAFEPDREAALPSGVSKVEGAVPVGFASNETPHLATAPTIKKHAQTKAAPRLVGDPCTSDSQCAGGKCLQVAGMEQNYCTQSCESQACPGASQCFKFSAGRWCLQTCEASAECHPWMGCDQDYTCWPTDNPIDGGNVAPGQLGDGCKRDADCAGGACLKNVGDSGYCSQRCEFQGCGPGGTCWNFSSIGRHCLKHCTAAAQCQSHLICDTDLTCWPTGTPVSEDSEPEPEPEPTPSGSGVGGACDVAGDCADGDAYCYPASVNDNPTGFVAGYCLVNQCTPGSCPSGSVCKAIYQGGATACVEACDVHADCRTDEGYGCLSWGADKVCWPACSVSGCPTGHVCNAQNNICVPGAPPAEVPDGDWLEPGAGPGPACTLPVRDCAGSNAYCSELLPFDPDQGPGYVDYPLNGEGWSNQYRSYARRDLIMLIKWATAYVDCKAASWGGGNGHVLGLGDMSEADGAIPGTSDNNPGHPPGTHVNGRDMDIAYYQKTGANNYLRPVCPHGGQYHCTGAPTNFDLWRTALFIGALLSSDRTRVIGVDGQIGPLVEDALDVLGDTGWLPSGLSSSGGYGLAYETENTGNGWYFHHHHHLHVSLWGSAGKPGMAGHQCLAEDCVWTPSAEPHTGCHIDAEEALATPAQVPWPARLQRGAQYP